MSNITICILFIVLGLNLGMMFTILCKLKDILTELDVIKFGVKDVIKSDANLIKDTLGNLEETVGSQNDKYLDILSKILDADEQLGKDLSTNLNGLIDTVRDRDTKIVDAVTKMHNNVESIKDYVADFVNTEDDRLTMITDHIREATINNSPPDEGG